MRDPRMHRCVAHRIAMLILAFMKFEVSELDFPGFLARLPARYCSTTLASFRNSPSHVGLDRLGGISSSFRAPGKGLLPVSDECWMVH